jgi:hypothetical protein
MKRFDPQQVYFCPDVDAPHCVEVTIPLMIDLIRRRGREKPEPIVAGADGHPTRGDCHPNNEPGI